MIKEYVYTGERETEYKDRLFECIEYIESKEYGTTLTKEELAKILGFNIELTKEYDKFSEKMVRIKNYLIEKGIILKSIAGVGYYILKPKQVSGYVYRSYTRRIDKLLAKGSKILYYTPKKDLSEIRTEEIDNLINLNADLIGNVNTIVENSAYYQNKDIYDNLKD